MNHYVTDAFTGIGMAVVAVYVIYALLMSILAVSIWFFDGR